MDICLFLSELVMQTLIAKTEVGINQKPPMPREFHQSAGQLAPPSLSRGEREVVKVLYSDEERLYIMTPVTTMVAIAR